MASLLLVTGPPGAGKSMVARVLVERFERSVLLEGDTFFAFVAATGLRWLHYVVLLPSLERCVARVTTREGHGFTDEAATRQMHQQFARANIDHRHLLFDPPDQVEATAERVLEAVTRGSLMYRSPSS